MSHQHEEMGKMFVGGLSWETTQEALCRYFSRFGEVIDCVVMKNSETGRSRGFGFVTFKDPSCVDIILSSAPHTLDGRTIDPKSCNPRSMQRVNVFNKKVRKGEHPKIFLGGLPSNITETDLRTFFSKYGKVVEVVIMYDQEKKRSRGFGFLSFEMEDSVDQVCGEHYITVNGKQVEVKKAEPRDGKSMGGGGRSSSSHWNGSGMGSGGMASPHMGGQPIGGHSMGPPPMSPIPNGMPGSIGFTPGGWGPPPQSFPPQGPFGAHAAPGYQSWGPHPVPYAPYAGPSPYVPPPATFGGYGYGYGWPGPAGPPGPGSIPAPVPAPVPALTAAANGVQPATSASTGSGDYASLAASGSVAASNAQGTIGAYAQDSSTYGPVRSYTGQDGYNSSGGSFAASGDATQTNSYSGSTQSGVRSGSHSGGYHPYRR